MRKSISTALLATSLAATLSLAACGNASTSTDASSTETEQSVAEGSAADEPSAQDTVEPAEEATDEPATEAKIDGAAYGYAGDDPVEAAVYRYMVEVMTKYYEKADASIPVVQIVHVDDSNPDDVTVMGDFWIDNYDIKGDTLECVSGGNYCGVMHVAKEGDAYTVSSFDMAADGSDFDPSARELFGEHYDDFMKVYGDEVARAEQRTKTVADYVRLNGLEVTQYQDYGWDPVPLSE